MNITFMIGNGFDRNLGLDTTFGDFIKEYIKLSGDETEVIHRFKQSIGSNTKLWSDAEIMLGKYTNEFEKGQQREFCQCIDDFSKSLSKYLINQEKRIHFNENEEKVKRALSHIDEFYKEFPLNERESIKTVFERYRHEQINYNFLCFT